ncbi:GNAT family N-acetyltransferase [Campylobacter coli]|uniref:GNAT family N-acetyltransferase n=1 Tax=Campylobacter coli TaxID=195 RepID=UPI001DF71C0C|nr:GNAT family N-acetyltransferase [Campylobacter coli]EHC5633084.1 GNAT family N-acetyltransferase [Campylobacter coli]EHR2890140.1 GNAT family N-acetyltransferase [Campylobacter coli]EIC9915318.1 GNAT family N-acetyltransferase [Campylobacter coli]EID5126900.1 GNAT family N-acetyltransferase [Campylobacter coli]EID5172764.1 GNAT family N-acetyltransferase [Campylobacter coli]
MKKNITQDGLNYRLRMVNINDADFIIYIRTEDLERNRYIHPISCDIQKQKEWIKQYLKKDNDYYFIIENKINGKPEGLISIYNIEHSKAEWGRWILQKGSLASFESVLLIFEVAFQKLNLNEIYCRTIADNKPVVEFHELIQEKFRSKLVDFFTLNDKTFDAIEHYASYDHYIHIVKPLLENKVFKVFFRNLKKELGMFEFHHIGIACDNIEKEFFSYKFLGYFKEDCAFIDTNQGVRGQFIVAANQPRLELLENLPNSDTLNHWLASSIKMYHFGYIVEDIEKAQKIFKQLGAKLISPLKYSIYFKKRICFLVLKNSFIVELIEK